MREEHCHPSSAASSHQVWTNLAAAAAADFGDSGMPERPIDPPEAALLLDRQKGLDDEREQAKEASTATLQQKQKWDHSRFDRDVDG